MSEMDLERAAKAVEELLRAVGVDPESDPELRETGRRGGRGLRALFPRRLPAGPRLHPGRRDGVGRAGHGAGDLHRHDDHLPDHLTPATGVAHVGYLPGERVGGLGAIARLVDCHAHRLALQEDLGRTIARWLVTHLGARAAGVVLDLAPTCLTARGGRAMARGR